MRRRTTALLLALSALVGLNAFAAAPPKIGRSVVVAAKPPDSRAQLAPACASDGAKSFLVAWQQGAKYYERADAKVYAARVSAEGKVLDTAPIALCAAKGSQERPRVAFAKGVYLVVWQDFRNGKNWDIYAARVKADGTLMDKESFAVASGPEEQALPDVAADANGFVVVWQDRRNGNGYEAWAARVSAEGKATPAGGAPIKTGGKPTRGGQVMVARAGDAFLLCWDNRYVGKGARFVGRLAEAGGAFTTTGAAKLASGMYGNFPTCMAGGATHGLLVSGGSQRSTKCCMGAVYDPKTVKPLANTNPSDKKVKGGSGWDTKVAIVLIEPLVPGWAPPGAAAGSGDIFLVAMRRAGGGKKAPSSPLLVIRVDSTGKKLDDSKQLPVLEDGKTPCSSPAVAGGAGGVFLVAYRVDEGPGRQVIRARVVSAK